MAKGWVGSASGWLVVAAAAALAGFIDAIVGGTGPFLVPALFAAHPQSRP